MSGNTILYLCIWAAIILVGLGAVTILGAGLRSLLQGRAEPLGVFIMAIPVALLAILGATMSTWAQAGIMTVLVMFGLSLLGLLFTGIRGLFT
ncbi:hypothetical protein [Salisaeta longa]|uniref:hypothetical protein n=1 Tax=Salisaeta longa TaxID=503170 RepID=UPI0003B79082|nr:hypothetical protein [Salisaeta longa]